jgi:hypothetical protein
MDDRTIKTPNPICRLFFKIGLLTDFAALCFTDFIDWRYIHSVVCIFDPAWTVAPMEEGTILVNCYPSSFSLTSPPSPLPKLKNLLYSIYRQCVWLGGDVELCCRPYAAVVLHSVSGQIQSLQNCYTTPKQITSKDDIKGLVSLSSFVHAPAVLRIFSESDHTSLNPRNSPTHAASGVYVYG